MDPDTEQAPGDSRDDAPDGSDWYGSTVGENDQQGGDEYAAVDGRTEASVGGYGAAASGGGQGSAAAAPNVTLDGLVLHPESAQGTHLVNVHAQIHNGGDQRV